MVDLTNTAVYAAAYALLKTKALEMAAFETTLPSKLRNPCIYKQMMPADWVANDLFAALKEAVDDRAMVESGQMYVYCGKEGSGKSAAGAAIIDVMLDKNQTVKVKNCPYLFVHAGDNLRANMRQALGVPDSMNDLDWLLLLFAKLKYVIVDRKTIGEQTEEDSFVSWLCDKFVACMRKNGSCL